MHVISQINFFYLSYRIKTACYDIRINDIKNKRENKRDLVKKAQCCEDC